MNIFKRVSVSGAIASILTLTIFVAASQQCFPQQLKAKVACIAFYNVENLFDTIDTPEVNDLEFTPNGINRWDSPKYLSKLANLSQVISGIGSEYVKGGPEIIGLCEIENRGVLEDLINTTALQNSNFGIVHYNSPDLRGVDVALLYKKSVFSVTHSTSNRLYMPGRDDFYSRDQLVVSGLLDGELIHIIVNHWPSRRSGPEYRKQAALLSRHLADSLAKTHDKAKIFIMGDLNDDPTDPSVLKVLGAIGRESKVGTGDLYNPFWQMHRNGIGSLAYRDAWNLFDQIIVSEPLLNAQSGTWKLYKARVYNPKFLLQKEGPFAGYPFRTFAGGAYTGGYSDHLPAYVFIVKESGK